MSWDGTAIKRVIETGDFYGDGNGWNETMMRRAKAVYRTNGAITDFSLAHYADGSGTGTTAFEVDLDADSGVSKHNDSVNKTAWMHRLKLEFTGDMDPLGYGFQAMPVREETR